MTSRYGLLRVLSPSLTSLIPKQTFLFHLQKLDFPKRVADMPNLRWLKLNQTGLECLPDELSHLMKLVSSNELYCYLVEFDKFIYELGLYFLLLPNCIKRCEQRYLHNIEILCRPYRR